ncbi:RHS repeat protein, partial [Mitsuaria sp. WAJ17]|uniref:RHS repeat protein n=1 Tax=Mitsuaria sp. WAJ17 TaxID=2761452 RepID=UPI001600FDF3
EASSRKVVVKGYDSAGQLAFESYPQRDASTVGITSPGRRMTYDALGRLLRTEADSELGVLTSTQAYLSGFQTQTTNPRNKTSTQSFWALDKPEDAKLASASLPAGVTVTITRDAFGKPTSISRGGVTRRYVYDAGQRLCKTLEPEVNATVQDYDLAGNLSWKAPGQNLTLASACDTLSVPAAAKISYGYDPMNRLTSTGYGDGSPGITREYWPDGKLKTVSSNGSSWSYAYNSLRLISTETLSYAGQSWAFSWGYSPNGHLASLSYPTGGPGVSYAPNALGEPSQVGSFATGLSFHPNGAVNSFRFGNGIQHTLTLNLRGLPQTNEDVGVMKDSYAYDANGNVNSISDQQESVYSRSMGYDDLDRLTSASAPGVWGAATYTYDAADNLKTANVGSRSVTLNYLDGTNRLNRVDVNGTQQLYDYDPYGNIKRKGAQQYFFDQGNRLQSAVPGGSYVYDGLGRRIQVSGGGDGSTRLSLYSQAG